MLNSFLPEHTSVLALPLFASIVCWLEFLLFLIEPFEVVVLRHNDFASAIELASEVRDFSFQGFHIRHGFFAPLSQPYPHGSSLSLFPSVLG